MAAPSKNSQNRKQFICPSLGDWVKTAYAIQKNTVQGKKDVTVSVSNEERSSVLCKP